MDRIIRQCIEDMEAVVASGKYSLEAQVRAYDLLGQFGDVYGDGAYAPADAVLSAVRDFCSAYAGLAQALTSVWDGSALEAEAAEKLKSLEETCHEARFEAAAAASLHEFAKEVFEVWKTEGVFARRRALRELRERAGFRLESHRIGNYVAKTFDLMNEAHTRFGRAQQALFNGNVSYKIQEGTYGRLAEMFGKF
ncbi:MAG: hypothetical protein IKU36_08070 [Bacteroidales bacterium]|nr:hypothetical protein [Bacteroidales bacterium]